MPSKPVQLIGMPWEFDTLWNEAMRSMPERPLQKRDHIWATEIGRDYANRYLKMHAHPYTNPFSDRSKRKFAMGHIIEWIVGVVLTVCGVIKNRQIHSTVNIKGCLRVTGKLDYVAGGEIDWDKARHNLEMLKNLFNASATELPPIIYACEKIIARMEMMFSRVPLREYIFECKSIGGRMADRLSEYTAPLSNHDMQTGTYLIAEKQMNKINPITEAMITYFSKDDAYCRGFTFGLDAKFLKRFTEDVKIMTGYHEASGKNYIKNIPPTPQEVVFHDQRFSFVKNFELEYSPYLSFFYPKYKDFDQFKWAWEKRLSGWNATFKRCVRQDKMTDLNKERIKDALKVFPEWDKYVLQARKAGAFQVADDDE